MKRVAPFSGVSVNVRTPLKRPSGMPPLQVIRSPGEYWRIFERNVRGWSGLLPRYVAAAAG